MASTSSMSDDGVVNGQGSWLRLRGPALAAKDQGRGQRGEQRERGSLAHLR